MSPRKTLLIALFLTGISCLCCKSDQKNNGSSGHDPFIYGVDTITGSQRTVASNLARSKVFSDFFQYINNAGYKETLDKPGPFTVFAPTNDALKKWKQQKKDDQLLAMLTDHIIAGSIRLSELNSPRKIKTLSGHQIELTADNDGIKVNGKKIYTVAINCLNGIIYPVNELLISSQ